MEEAKPAFKKKKEVDFQDTPPFSECLDYQDTDARTKTFCVLFLKEKVGDWAPEGRFQVRCVGK